MATPPASVGGAFCLCGQNMPSDQHIHAVVRFETRKQGRWYFYTSDGGKDRVILAPRISAAALSRSGRAWA